MATDLIRKNRRTPACSRWGGLGFSPGYIAQDGGIVLTSQDGEAVPNTRLQTHWVIPGNPDPEQLGTLRRPWRRSTPSLAKGVKNPETVPALSPRNYKVYADLGLSPSILVRQLTILDTGAGSNFVRVDTLPPGWEALVIPGEIPTIADANGRPLRTSGQIPLVVRLGDRTMRFIFIVCERLAAPVILGCEFNDKFVEAIYPRRKVVELDDGTKIPIVRKPAARAASATPLPSEQEYAPDAGRISPTLKVSRVVEIPAGTQTWVYVTSGRARLSVLEANPQLYAKHRISLSNWVVHIAPLQDFKVLVANFSSASKRLSKNQVVGFVTPPPRAMLRTTMPLGAVLAAACSEGSPLYRARGPLASPPPKRRRPPRGRWYPSTTCRSTCVSRFAPCSHRTPTCETGSWVKFEPRNIASNSPPAPSRFDASHIGPGRAPARRNNLRWTRCWPAELSPGPSPSGPPPLCSSPRPMGASASASIIDGRTH